MKCEIRTLAELAKIRYGKELKDAASEDSSDIPVYGTGGLMGYTKRALYDKPSVLIGRKGTIEKVRYVEDPFWTVDTLFYTEINTEIILPKYFFYLLNRVDLRRYDEGTTIPSLRTETLNRLKFKVPPLETQRKIASILSSLDDKIELNDKINANLEEQARAIFKSWFVDFEPFGGKMPEDWHSTQFKEILTPVSDKSDDESIPMFSVTDTGLYPRSEKFKKNLTMKNTKGKIIRENDIVFGMSREILNWGVMHSPVGRVSSAYNVYHIREDVNSFYLESYMKAHIGYFKDLIRPASREGQGVDKGALMGKEIYLPPKSAVEDYYKIENSITKMVSHVLSENRRLSSLRDALLPRLLSGELDVSKLTL